MPYTTDKFSSPLCIFVSSLFDISFPSQHADHSQCCSDIAEDSWCGKSLPKSRLLVHSLKEENWLNQIFWEILKFEIWKLCYWNNWLHLLAVRNEICFEVTMVFAVSVKHNRYILGLQHSTSHDKRPCAAQLQRLNHKIT